MARGGLTPGRRIGQRVSRLTARLDRRQTLLGVIVVAIGAFLAFVAFQATTGPPFQVPYKINVTVPSGSPTLRVGQAVRIGGQLAGLISHIEPDRAHDDATVTANITKPAFRPLPEDTTAYVRVHSIVYETYLELRPGTSDQDLPNGAHLAATATSGTDLLEVVELFDEKTREQLSQTVVNNGFGLAGRGVELNQALNDLPGMARNLASQAGAATERPGALGELIAGAAQTARGLRGYRSDDVGAFIAGADATFKTIAGRSEDLRRALQLLPPFEQQVLRTAPEAEPLLRDLADVSHDLEPTVRAVRRQLPDVNRLLGKGNTLRNETRRITAVADPALKAAKPVVFNLFPTLTALDPLNSDLAKLKATVEPYKPEIAQAGKWLGNATSIPSNHGLAAGAPSARVLAVLTPHKCTNPIPKPGTAQKDKC
ncbi:MAG: phospholipid/cholesterol/gamma-HCH transport system substrate-binding protein [Thermoleophilaceae bacterium]|jgi:ABC-type transporter Mla subunit MlaD|nr:phospholipid/cholesterol/gamma-HCH transport system substrate-binding protein [Thermoleophilaceae bacterium]